MAINIETLRTRALTALVFVAVMLVGLFWNSWSFIILFTIVHFGCWYEFIKLMKKIYGKEYLKYSVLGLVYITIPIWMLIDMRLQDIFNRPNILVADLDYILPCTIIFSIWINDTMAYIVGSFIGKTPFSKISPKKTWEGTIGGALLSVLAIGLAGYFIVGSYRVASIIAAICAIFGTAGDLLESKIKRTANVKDSGTIMPGHGGFLDRFDSLLLAVPFVWIYLKLTNIL